MPQSPHCHTRAHDTFTRLSMDGEQTVVPSIGERNYFQIPWNLLLFSLLNKVLLLRLSSRLMIMLMGLLMLLSENRVN